MAKKKTFVDKELLSRAAKSVEDTEAMLDSFEQGVPKNDPGKTIKFNKVLKLDELESKDTKIEFLEKRVSKLETDIRKLYELNHIAYDG